MLHVFQNTPSDGLSKQWWHSITNLLTYILNGLATNLVSMSFELSFCMVLAFMVLSILFSLSPVALQFCYLDWNWRCLGTTGPLRLPSQSRICCGMDGKPFHWPSWVPVWLRLFERPVLDAACPLHHSSVHCDLQCAPGTTEWCIYVQHQVVLHIFDRKCPFDPGRCKSSSDSPHQSSYWEL